MAAAAANRRDGAARPTLVLLNNERPTAAVNAGDFAGRNRFHVLDFTKDR
jgi:hypothetical protein